MNCKYCSKFYDKNKNLNKHESHCLENPNRIPYTCVYCEKNIEDLYKYSAHIAMV